MKYKLNLKNSIATTVGNKKFLDVPKDGSIRVRLLPPTEEDGSLFTLVTNHYRLKDEEEDRGIALACLKRHGEDSDCFLCDLSEYLRASGGKGESKIGNLIKPSNRWYCQAMAMVKDDETGTFKAGDIKLLGLPKTAATDINGVLEMQYSAGEPFLCDIEQGRDIIISRKDTGVQFTKYSVMPAGMPVDLADIKPEWESQLIQDVEKELGLRVMDVDKQIATATRTYPELDWDSITASLGE